jgi:hypothetical protein
MVSELCAGQRSMCKNEQRAITQKLGKKKSRFFALHFHSMRSLYLKSFMSISLILLEFCNGQTDKVQSVKMNKGQNSKIRQERVMVLLQCTSTQ